MIQLMSHQVFFQHTTALTQELAAIESSVKQQEKQLFQRLNLLTQAVRAAAMTKSESTVVQAVKQYLDATHHVLNAWQNKVQSYEAGLSLREKFGDSLLVFVYGKVKAGKSSLGNYIATAREKPDADWLKKLAKELHSPEFFTEAVNTSFAEKIDYNQGFQVGPNETTGSIQGFVVPGLTWVDSPGLHSVNSTNGDLAEQYVESADLVIYPMNSAQPGRESDMQELEVLLKAGKRILVLITRCDDVEQDWDFTANALVNRLVMKSAKDRHDQETYIQGELDALCERLNIKDADTSVLSVSVRYAETHGNAALAMQESGMQQFFDKMQGILNSEGIRLKKQAPIKNLQTFYQLILADYGDLSIHEIIRPLETALVNLAQQEQQLQQLTDIAKDRVKESFYAHVERLVEHFAQLQDMTTLGESLERAIAQAVQQEYEAKLVQHFQKTLSLMSELPKNMGLSADLSFCNKTVDVQVNISRKAQAVGTGIGSVLGAGIGFLLGGPAGAAFGGSLGGVVVGQASSVFNSSEMRAVVCGDNREDIKDSILAKGNQLIEQSINAMHQFALQDVMCPVRMAITTVLTESLAMKEHIKNQASAGVTMYV